MKVQEIRQAFLDHFIKLGHTQVPSSPLIPGNDATLLFTNAGMVQFKETFLGQETRPYTRATSVQRCVRAGGKHNDLENVGYTARHHTFFEMLGNFSFGDYFKEDAIRFAWSFLTEVLKLPEEKLWVTVYEDDPEAEALWLQKMGVSAERFSRCGAKDNFWQMGDTGPCGPCTEIFYDHGADVPGGPPGSPDEDGDRYIEIWNLVFMQYDRDANGHMNPLPKPSVDTGMGLERLAAVLQGVHSNYEIDLFQNLMKAIAKELGLKDHEQTSVRVIADHIRSCAFLAVDGVTPSNEGRGYVMRRIVRRALRHGHKLGGQGAFFYKLVAPLVHEMGAAYPELAERQAIVEKVLRVEEERFAETLDQGMRVFDEVVADLNKGDRIPGEAVFRLYDTYGFPVDLTADIARERELEIDHDGYEEAMTAQRERARAASQFKAGAAGSIDLGVTSTFTGYEHLTDSGKVLALLQGENPVDALVGDVNGAVVLDQTPFYAESGGQVGDQGYLRFEGGAVFRVDDTQKAGDAILHLGVLESGSIKKGDRAEAVVAGERADIARNHSATHLLHAALRTVLGEHVQQKGSLVQCDRLRFDFTHFEPVTSEQLRQIEHMVNEQILANHEVETRIMKLDEARASGAMALFGEKYGESVRVLKMSTFSTELCGGTHVERTGDIGMLKILSETGIASGVRRIEATSGRGAQLWVDHAEEHLQNIAGLLKSGRDDVEVRVRQLLEQSRGFEKEIERLKAKLAASAGADLVNEAEAINGVNVLVAKLEGADAKALRDTADQLKSKLGTAALLLSAVEGEKVLLLASVSKDATDRVHAGELLKTVAAEVGGKGGGRPDMAQGGGTQPENLAKALDTARAWIRERL